MSDPLKEYEQLRCKRYFVKTIHHGRDSAEEDAILDKMDDVWWKLTREEQAQIRGWYSQYLEEIEHATSGVPSGWVLVDAIVEQPGDMPRVLVRKEWYEAYWGVPCV